MGYLLANAVLLGGLVGIFALIFRGRSALRRGRTPKWLMPPAGADGGAAKLLDGLLGAAALSQVLPVLSLGSGDVLGGLMGLAVAFAASGFLTLVVDVSLGVLGLAASWSEWTTLVYGGARCASPLSTPVRLAMLLAMLSAFMLAAIVSGLVVLPYRRRMLRRYAKLGLGLYGALEFVLVLTLLGAVTQSSVPVVLGVLGALVVGTLTPMFPELTIWVMGTALLLYALIGGTWFSYSGEPLVRACLGQQIDMTVFLGFGVGAGVGFLALRRFRRS